MKKHHPVGPAIVVCAVLLHPASGRAQIWTPTGAPATNWSAIACSADSSKVFAAGGVIYVSSDTGSTWTPTATPAADWPAIACSTDGRIIVAVGSMGTWISTNSGVSWAGPQWDNFRSIACSASGASMIGGVPPGMHGGGNISLSADAGTSWSPQYDLNTPSYCVAVASSADATRLVAAGNNFLTGMPVWASSDAGATWTQIGWGSWLALACSADGTRIYGGQTGGIRVFENSSGAWQSTMTPELLEADAVACSADGTRSVVAQGRPGGSIYTSTNSGVTWVSNSVPLGYWSCVVCSADGSRLFAGMSGGGGIYTSSGNPSTALTITRSAESVLLSWITPAVEFKLEESADLTNWSGLDVIPVLNYTSLRQEVSLPVPTGPRFYRLAPP